jgi:hypothetical protein
MLADAPTTPFESMRGKPRIDMIILIASSLPLRFYRP